MQKEDSFELSYDRQMLMVPSRESTMMMMMTMTDHRAMDPSAGGNGGDDEGLPDIEGLRFTDQQSEALNRTAGSSSVDVESASLVCDMYNMLQYKGCDMLPLCDVICIIYMYIYMYMMCLIRYKIDM